MATRGRKNSRPVTLYLRMHRELKGLKLEYIGRRCGVTNATVSRWELSTNGPPMSILPTLAREYGCTVDDLYYPPKEADE